MDLLCLGRRAPAVAQVRRWLTELGLAAAGTADAAEDELFDPALDAAVRAFQQQRGLTVDGIVGPETFQTLEGARWRIGGRSLYLRTTQPYVGDDVLTLQHRLVELGFDVGHCDGAFGPRTAAGLREFQRNCGLRTDGVVGPETLRALRQLSRSVVGGRAHGLREADALHRRGPTLVGKAVIIDAGHGGDDPGWIGAEACERDVVADLAARLEGRLAAAGVTAYLTHGPQQSPSQAQRAAFANDTDADLLISLHTDGQPTAVATGVATYFYGTARGGGSVAGERLADLVQREVVARTGLLDTRIHPKSWDLLRLTRMPAIRLEVGYLSNPGDASLLLRPESRDAVAEALLVAIQRLFLPAELTAPTGPQCIPALAN